MRERDAATAAVLCVGQSTLDHTFSVAGVLDPGHKHIAAAHTIASGGLAANAAVAVARLGGHATLVSCVGDDEAGRLVAELLGSSGVGLDLLRRVRGTATSESAVILTPDGARTVVNHTPAHLADVACPTFDDVRADAVLVDGRWPAASVAALQRARDLAVPGVVDVDRAIIDRGLREQVMALATDLIFSEDALAAMTGRDEPAEGLTSIACSTGARVAVTCGEQGVLWLDRDSDWHPDRHPDGVVNTVAAFPIVAVDTNGAGDAFHGAFALSLAEGKTAVCGLRFASAAAALKCATGSMPNRADVDALLESRSDIEALA